jgi:antibiotic biosynthesis monooxygenase (ABM) superfamily enzyme
MSASNLSRIGVPIGAWKVDKTGRARSGPQSGPARLKIAFLTWVGAYAVITLIIGVLGPTIASWPLPLRTLLISVLMVIALSGFVIPTLTRIFAGWITPARRDDQRLSPEDQRLSSVPR